MIKDEKNTFDLAATIRGDKSLPGKTKNTSNNVSETGKYFNDFIRLVEDGWNKYKVNGKKVKITRLDTISTTKK